ncbi:guanylate kinase-associated protein mars [Lucilia cuprina]|uniref:guanylate kinase-associated protein mars n=1 Tax=Lucilia cuprina TaxID=7375 RepID=UPI001F056376|nr:guanylate kinase-associated protein mars [Lucilia cuprina]
MDFHKSLYHEMHSQTPHHKRENRRLQEANRIKQRRDRFQNSRNISVSPVRHKEILIPLCPDDKENENQTDNPNSTRLAKLVCNTNNPEKLKKQEAFLKRFAEWMDKKKNAKTQQEGVNKKKPFISAVNSGGKQASATCSIVPKGHHDGFRPPTGLKSQKPNEKAEPINKPILKGRQSIYTVVPTPPRKPKETNDKLKNKFPIVRKALPTNLHTRILNSNKTPNVAAANSAKAVNKLQTKTPVDKPKPVVKKNSTTKPTLETKTATATLPTLRSTLKPRVLKMPPPPAPKTKAVVKKPEPTTTTTNRQTGAAAKARNLATKRLETNKQTKKSPLKAGGARLAQNLKAKKPLNTSKKLNVPNVQVNGKEILSLFKNNNNINNKPLAEDMVIQTPKDFTLNPFEEFVTSTKLRNSSHNLENLEDNGISPIETSPKRAHTVKKFNFIRYSEAPNVSDNDAEEIEQVKENPPTAKSNDLSDEENKTLVETPAVDEKTPIKSKPEEKPANYLSPFVSVTRGKVSLKKEKEKRNSIYLQNPSEDNDATTVSTSPLKSPKYSVEVRRTLEAVRYFRKQLQDEIDRLHQQCDIWEAYKNENLEKLQIENVEDMINVTIGQTRLLTSKKFMQFKGLIDRCEAGATGIGAVEYDGSEDTKPITAVDLEGFWSMLGLQVDNLEKRFDNLNRWKLNDWIDPEEAKPKIKKNLTKVKKAKAAPATKAKPSSALQQMLRKMQAEKRKNRNQPNGCNEDVVLTPSKQNPRRSGNSNNSTPRKSMDSSQTRRLSIVVKDRKYFSPAATVISVSSPNRRNSMIQRKTSQDSPKLLKHIEKFNETLDNMQSSLDLRKSVLINGNSRRMSINPQSPMRNSLDKVGIKETVMAVNGIFTVGQEEQPTSSQTNFNTSPQHSPVPTGRKSILKTPGTAKSRLRNVIFNEKLRVKKFNFLINEDDQLNGDNGDNEANESHEEDLAQRVDEDEPQRTLTLRNRKVRLRPSCEIVIPSK